VAAGPAGERVLVNFFYAQPVGHGIEALHYCLGHHTAEPAREISVALNSATAVELAGFCPFVAHTYAIEHPLRLNLPQRARTMAATRWAAHDAANPAGGRIALMPAGSGPAELYPSRGSWLAGRFSPIRHARSTASTSRSPSSSPWCRAATCSCPHTPASAWPRWPWAPRG
jgi:hypothetical protein